MDETTKPNEQTPKHTELEHNTHKERNSRNNITHYETKQTNLIDIYVFCCGIRQTKPNFVYHLSAFARERGAEKDDEQIHQKQ